MSESPTSDDESLPVELKRQVDAVCNRFEAACKQGLSPRIDDYLGDVPEPARAVLRHELELLEAHYHRQRDEANTPAGSPTAEFVETVSYPPVSEALGVLIAGRYKLLQKLGEGGMGTVYMAEQEQPVKRRVALKIIKLGMDSAQVIARFEQERQALAMMDHPNIAKVLDAGTTEENSECGTMNDERRVNRNSDSSFIVHHSSFRGAGRPFFVMELVKGIPLTKFCDQEHLTPRERLELFIPVCQAVQHAHQKGIIHRDLKPSNVLVALYDGKPVPKVIDFGVAKATQQKLTERTMFTEVGSIVGTLEYMAPEQAELNNLDIDTRADIYSLGVILYELLTGSPPFTSKELRSAAFTEMLRMIREVEPPKPSTKLSSSAELPSIAAQRKLEPKRLTKLVSGELDWIAMKCLEKDRARRYETANALAFEIQRYLNDEPVLAGPPSVGYRLKKFVKRHRAEVFASVGLAVLLMLGIVALGIGIVAVNAERRRAELALAGETRAKERTAEALRKMTDEVVEELLGKQPQLSQREKQFLRDVERFYEEFTQEEGQTISDRALRAEGYHRVATVRQKLGERAEAESAYQQAIALREQLSSEFPNMPEYRQELARSHLNMGALHWVTGRLADAEQELRGALALRESLSSEFPDLSGIGHDLAESYNNLGKLLSDLGQRPESGEHYRRAIDHLEKLATASSAVPNVRDLLATVHNNLGNLLFDLGQTEEAEEHYRRAIAVQEKLSTDFAAVHGYREALAQSHMNLGTLMWQLGKQEEAVESCRRAIPLEEKLSLEFPAMPEYRRALAATQNNLGVMLRDMGKLAEADLELRRAIAHQEKLSTDFPDVPHYRQELARSHQNLAGELFYAGKREAALEGSRLAITIQEKLCVDFPTVSQYEVDLAGTLLNFGIMLAQGDEQQGAQDSLTKAIDKLDRVIAQVGHDETARQYLAGAHTARAEVREKIDRHSEAAKDWGRAIELAPGPSLVIFRLRQAFALVRGGSVEQAITIADSIVDADLAPGSEPKFRVLYQSACVFALAAAAIKEPDQQSQHASHAVTLLRRAIAAGWKDFDHIQKDPDLSVLRDLPEFKDLLPRTDPDQKK